MNRGEGQKGGRVLAEQSMGFSIRIFLPGGNPEGLRVIEKSNWSGRGIFIPRSLYSEAKRRPELERAGVYVLLGEPEGGRLPLAYVGEGDPIGPRLDQHAKSKDFWTHVVAFVSKDDNLNKAHVQFLEARLVSRAAEAKRCQLQNGNVPQLPTFSEADAADAEGFLAEMLLCLPVLGLPFFEARKVPTGSGPELSISAKGVTGRGRESPGGFLVLSGSKAVTDTVPSIHAYMAELRRELIANGVLAPSGGDLAFTQDYEFASPSTAAGVILGRTANGRTEWKDKAGRTLKEIQTQEASRQ